MDKSKRYVLPVTILDASNIEVLESARTAYFIFKGAALINVVANIKEIYFPINWKSSVSSLSTVTIEALVRSEDWVAGRDNALSSVFGIEGKFLIRVGDADRPRDQVQVVAPGGNFPGPNTVAGLPVNEWVHIAVVYDNTRWLPGDISEGRVWSVQRTAEQIATNPYEVDPASEGLVAYWKFNEGAGNVITDQTGHGNDITGSGDPTWVQVELPKIN